MNEKNPMELRARRDKIFHDFYTNITPERPPILTSLVPPIVAGYARQDMHEWHYNAQCLLPVMEELAQKVVSDVNPFMPPALIARPCTMYQLLGSQSFVIAENGLVQHPEVVGMMADEYPQLISRGFDFLMDTVVPRQHKNLDFKNPGKMASTIHMTINERGSEMGAFMPAWFALNEKMGYHLGGALASGGASEAPFDFLADQLRGFSQISLDVRRRRSEILEAMEVLTPLCYKMGRPAAVDYQTNIFYPLHMPTFMREKDFVELWLPSFKRILQQDVAHGIRPFLFVEDDWTRYLDIIKEEFPAGCILWIDEGDPALFKEKLGKKFILTGLFPLKNLRLYEKDELLARLKDFLDIMLPGCGYFFGFDKTALGIEDIPFEKFTAVLDYVQENSRYDNAGEPYGTPLNVEGFQIDQSLDAPIKSDYLFDWDSYKAAYPLAPEASRARLEAAKHQTFMWYMNLLF